VAEGRLGQERHRAVRLHLGLVHLGLGLDQTDRRGGHGHGPDGLLVTLVADVENGVALAGPDLQLVVDLGDEGTDGVDDDPVQASGVGHHLGRRSVGRQHERSPGRNLVDGVDEDHPLGPELLDDVTVVDDLVVAVDGRLEDTDHPRQGLDGLLHPGAEPPGGGQEDPLNGHGRRLPAGASGPAR
jgi:hypothetical protein